MVTPIGSPVVTTPGGSGDPANHAPPAGSDRILILYLADEVTSQNVSAVTVNGRSMVQVAEVALSFNYITAWRLLETDIAALSTGDFAVTWDLTVQNVVTCSRYFEDAHQTTPTGTPITGSASSATTLALSALTTANGDYAMYGGGTGEVRTFDFTGGGINDEICDASQNSSSMGVAEEAATGGNLTPSYAASASTNRLVGLAFVIKTVGGGTTHQLTGTLALALTLSAGLRVIRDMAGTATLALAMSGPVNVLRGLGGQLATALALTGGIGVTRALAGSQTWALALAANVGVKQQVTGSIALAMAMAGNLTIQGEAVARRALRLARRIRIDRW